jgi:hypothetical protein
MLERARREARHRGESQRAHGQPTTMKDRRRPTQRGVAVASKADRFAAPAMTSRRKMDRPTL